jgi:hypothetical protein
VPDIMLWVMRAAIDMWPVTCEPRVSRRFQRCRACALSVSIETEYTDASYAGDVPSEGMGWLTGHHA